MFVTNPIGIIGEEEAVKMLRKKGLRIIEHNWRLGHLEIDLIAENRHEIVFVEVKARTSTYGGKMPEEYVDETKRNHMVVAANAYIKSRHIAKDIRFDIIGILVDPSTKKITYSKHLENAFTPHLRTISSGSYSGNVKWQYKRK